MRIRIRNTGSNLKILEVFKKLFLTVFRIRIKKCRMDPDPHEQMRIRIEEVKKLRK